MIGFHSVKLHGFEVGEGGTLVVQCFNLSEGIFNFYVSLILLSGEDYFV
jgi:hypothetical protein